MFIYSQVVQFTMLRWSNFGVQVVQLAQVVQFVF